MFALLMDLPRKIIQYITFVTGAIVQLNRVLIKIDTVRKMWQVLCDIFQYDLSEFNGVYKPK